VQRECELCETMRQLARGGCIERRCLVVNVVNVVNVGVLCVCFGGCCVGCLCVFFCVCCLCVVCRVCCVVVVCLCVFVVCVVCELGIAPLV
jgi:hypothetical protein